MISVGLLCVRVSMSDRDVFGPKSMSTALMLLEAVCRLVCIRCGIVASMELLYELKIVL